MVRINLEVQESTKVSWETFVENNTDYDSLTHMVKLAVEHEMGELSGNRPRGRGDDVSNPTPGAQNSGTPDEVEQELKGMQNTIESLADTVEDLELDTQLDVSDEQLMDAIHNATAFLPAIPPGMSFFDFRESDSIPEEVSIPPEGFATHPEGIAEKADLDPFVAKKALSKAARDLPHVHSERVNGVREYYQDE